jgi:molybdate transport system substrate-binding protein
MRQAKFSSVCIIASLLFSFGACSGPGEDLDIAAGDGGDQRQVRVLTSGGFTVALNILGPIFAEATGIAVIIEYGSSMGGGPESIPIRLAEGELHDVLIFNDAAYDQLASAGQLRPDTRRDLGRSLIAMAVRSGAPIPDISTTGGFIETVINANSIGYSASASGTYISTELFPRLGIWEQIQNRSTRVVTERVASVVARGEVEIGFQAVSEILPIEGAAYVGPIPEEFQLVSTFLAVFADGAENTDHAQRLVDFLASEAAAGIIESTGLRPVALEQK